MSIQRAFRAAVLMPLAFPLNAPHADDEDYRSSMKGIFGEGGTFLVWAGIFSLSRGAGANMMLGVASEYVVCPCRFF